MKIEFGSTTLGDDATGDFITPAVSRSHTREVQQDPLLGADNPFTTPRKNSRNQISFIIEKEHADVAAAILYVWTYPDALDGQAALKVTEGATIYQMADATLQGAELVQLTGKSTAMRFSFTGGAIAIP